MNIANLPRFIDGFAGILLNTEEGTKYTVIDLEGNKMFEERPGTMCDTLTSKIYRISRPSELSVTPEVVEVIDEKGNTLFNVNSEISYFTNGYALKDKEIYVRTDGTELQIMNTVKK